MIKRFVPWIITAAVALVVFAQLRPAGISDGNDWEQFGSLPVILNGRTKPLDTVARTSLRVIHEKQNLRLEDDSRLPAIEWLGEVLFDAETADSRPIFTIRDPDVLGLFNWQQDDEKHFSMDQLRPHLEEIQRQARLASAVEAQRRDFFQNHILKLYNDLILFHSLKNSLHLEDSPNFSREIDMYHSIVGPGMDAMNRRAAGGEFDDDIFNSFLFFADRYRRATEFAHFLAIPLDDPESGELRTDWKNVGASLIETTRTGEVHPALRHYADLGASYRAGDAAEFNRTLNELITWIGERYERELKKAEDETLFNRYQPFYQATTIYLLVGIVGCVSWLFKPGWLGRTAYLLASLAFIIHTSGLVFRVYLQEYPPVTNLYSAAVLVGWGAAGIGLLVERLYRNGIGSVVAAVVGFGSLLVAHHLSFSGDTMEMMQAVLDSNFWLSVHVPTIVLGYSANFAAGTVGIFYLILGVFSRKLTKDFSRSLTRMAYGIICFATLLSFVGTVLGGIWADQSWGRFWGWDPKENGAAMLVIWNAIILHARWGGYIRERGIMVMAIFGNVITAWSYFGTNLLGIGLHSYGFTESGFYWLLAFILSQLAIMALALIPRSMWRSSPPDKNRQRTPGQSFSPTA